MTKSVSHAVSLVLLDRYQFSGLILVSQVDTACDTDFVMYYSICNEPYQRSCFYNILLFCPVKNILPMAIL